MRRTLLTDVGGEEEKEIKNKKKKDLKKFYLGNFLKVKKKKKVFVDPKSEDFAKYQGAFIVIPNLKEFGLALKITPQIKKTCA